MLIKDLEKIENYLGECLANYKFERGKVENWPVDDKCKKQLIKNYEKSIKELEQLIELIYAERVSK